MNSHVKHAKNVGKGLAKTALYSVAGVGLGVVVNRTFFSRSFEDAWDLSKYNMSQAKGSLAASTVVSAVSMIALEYLKDSLE